MFIVTGGIMNGGNGNNGSFERKTASVCACTCLWVCVVCPRLSILVQVIHQCWPKFSFL